MLKHYILKGKEVVPCEDLTEWAHWMDTNDRIVGRDQVGDVLVSTVFLGLDHSFSFKTGAHLFFETMIFYGPTDNEMMRCSTYEQAEAMHRSMVEEIREMQEESQLAIKRACGVQTGG